MKIKCPKCGFSKDVPESRLPGKNVIATCPRCACRFPLADAKHAYASQENNEEEDIRIVASRAYQREAQRFEREKSNADNSAHASGKSNPWDAAPGAIGWLASFYQTVLRVMFAAPQFFTRLNPKSGLGRALSFFLVIIAVQLLMQYVWGNVLQSSLPTAIHDDPQMEKLLNILAQNNKSPFGMLVGAALLVLQLYIFTFLLFLAYRIIAPAKTTFSLIFQLAAYSTAPYLLCLVPIAGSIAGMFWSLGCLLTGCRAALGLDWARTIIGFLPIIFLIAPLFLQFMKLAAS